eukprot:1082327-Prymnesium_polylepis.1
MLRLWHHCRPHRDDGEEQLVIRGHSHAASLPATPRRAATRRARRDSFGNVARDFGQTCTVRARGAGRRCGGCAR